MTQTSSQKENINADDFTTKHYRDLISLAKCNYQFTTYDQIAQEKKIILWRHDCDLSLNRALRLAEIEHEEGVVATYFVNLHAEFYNILEKSQTNIINRIIQLGHKIGLHFDADYHDITSEEQLAEKIRSEARIIENVFGQKLTAFSFHNPTEFLLKCENETYGGLVNCYSKHFKERFSYCSDSNGYWRFHRLENVINDSDITRLQVLTHPGWWQETPMHPRERIFRAAYGRADAIMHTYDQLLQKFKRSNHSGPSEALLFIKEANPKKHALLDYLWNKGSFATLFVELWRLHEIQINKLSKAVLRKEWRIPAVEVNLFFETRYTKTDGWRFFEALTGLKWKECANVSSDDYHSWLFVRNQLVHGKSHFSSKELEKGCVFLCHIIQNLATWGKKQSFSYNGISHLGSIGLPTKRTATGELTDLLEDIPEVMDGLNKNKWECFKKLVLSHKAEQ